MSTVTRKIPRLAPRRLALALFFVAAGAGAALAHEGKPHTPRDLLTTWGLEPVVLISLALAAWLYVRGVRRLWRESSAGLGIRKWEAASYGGGWFALFVALVSPLHPMGSVLFSAHMTQHEVLMLIAAPLLVLGRPLIAYLWALPTEWRRKAGRVGKVGWVEAGRHAITNPLAAWAIHAVVLWVWHAPVLFQATLKSELVHTTQHLSFLLSALLTFASSLWCPAYSATTESWGLTPLEDQQLGGLIMWVPAGLVYLFAGLTLFAGWLRESERRVVRREGQPRSYSEG